MSSTENVSGAPVRRSRLWWLRTPHTRLLSEWIELKTDAPATPEEPA